MKNKFKLLLTGGVSAVLLLPFFAFTQSQEPKKTRHIKMMKIENGKKMEIDTVLTGDDVFVWNGDTLSPEKHIKKFSPSEFDKRHPEPMDRDFNKRRSPIRRGGALDDPRIMHGDSTEDIQIFMDEGDTVGQKIIIHKMRRNGDEKDHFIYLNSPDGGQFPPVPGVPPVPHIKRFRAMHSSKMINLNDPNVISFKKKDIGGGREKIEIIRKKTKESDNMDLNMEMNHLIDIPQPPIAPEMDIEIERGDRQNMIKEKTESETKKGKKAKANTPMENK